MSSPTVSNPVDEQLRGSAVDETVLGPADTTAVLDRVVASSPVGAIVVDDEGTIAFANAGFSGILGYLPPELVGEPFSTFVVNGDRSSIEPAEVLGEANGRTLDLDVQHQAGHAVTVTFDFREFEVEGERLFGGYASAPSVAAEYEQATNRYEAIAEMAGDGVYQLDTDSRFEMVSDTLVDLTGYSRDELLGEHASKLFDEAAISHHEDAIEGELGRDEDGQVTTVEFPISTADGDTVPMVERIAVLATGDMIHGTVGVVRDVSERRERVEELRQERELIEHILETSPVGIGVITPDGDISRVNDRAEDLLGLTMEEITNQTLDVSQRKLYGAEGEQVEPEDLLSRVFDEGEQVINSEFTLERPTGDRVWAAISIAPMTGGAGEVEKAVIIATDISDRKEREETLREERDVIEHILETSPVGIGVITPDGDISRVNDRAEELFGLTDYELSNRTLDVSQRKLYDSEGQPVSPEDLLSRVFDDGERVLDTEFEFGQPDGDRIWLSISIAPIPGPEGDVQKAVIIGKDATDRKEREETLREERELIQHVLETSPVGIGVITPDGDISRVNDRAEELLGLTMEEITNQTLDVSQRKLYDSEGQQVAPEDLLSRVFDDEEQVLNSEFTLERPDGDRVWAAISIAPMTGGAGEVEKAVIIATDVSDRKEREDTLREERELIEHILETSPVGIGVITPDGDISRVNDRAEDLLGLTMEEITNQTLDVSQRKLYGAEGQQVEPEDLLSRVFDDGEQVINSEFTLEQPDGDRVWAAISIAPMTGGAGEVEKAVIIATDVSDRKEREETLREERDVIEHILETSPVGIGVITPDGDISRVNDRAEDLLGLTMEEITNQTLDVSQRKLYGVGGERVPPEDLLSRVFDDGEQVINSEFTLERPTGDRVWAAISIAPIESRGGNVLKAVVIATDISERKERERRLRESEARLRQIAENINSAIWMADADMSEVLYINPAYEDITGRSRDSVYGNLMNHVDAVHPQDQRRVENAVKQATRSPRANDGVLRFQEKYRIVRPDGSTRWVNSFAFPLRDENGEVYRFVGVIDDITEVKEQQLELGRHRDELETLNQINTVIRRVNQGLVQATNREEIEKTVCKTLTDSMLYYAAWTGEADGGVRGLEPKTGTGINADALETTFAIAEVDPIATAVESGDIQIIRDFADLPTGLAVGGPGGAGLRDNGQPFAAVIPLVYKETVYDVLVAYSSRANAFGAREQAVLLELGKTIGLAINAVERKKALLTNAVEELTFDIQDRDLFFVRAVDDTDAVFEMEGITSQSDGSYLQYFTVTGASSEEILDLSEEDPSIEHARVVNDHEDAFLIEMVNSSSLASTLAEYGASVRSATFEDGRGTIVADLPQTADIRTAVEAVGSRFADSELVSKSKRERSVQTSREFQTTLEKALTDRQLSTLSAAYYAGFFKWPRDSSGEQVADSLDVAPATFHEHLRAGERKLVQTLVDEAEAA